MPMHREKSRKQIIHLYGVEEDISNELIKPIFTYGFVKPHAYSRRTEIIDDIEHMSKGRHTPLHIFYGKDHQLTRELAEAHYWMHGEKDFFEDLISMITEGPTYQFILEGENAINSLASIAGATDPRKASQNTIRGKYGDKRPGMIAYNAVHRADSLETFVHEVSLHFSRDEMTDFFWQRYDAYKEWIESQKPPAGKEA